MKATRPSPLNWWKMSLREVAAWNRSHIPWRRHHLHLHPSEPWRGQSPHGAWLASCEDPEKPARVSVSLTSSAWTPPKGEFSPSSAETLCRMPLPSDRVEKHVFWGANQTNACTEAAGRQLLSVRKTYEGYCSILQRVKRYPYMYIYIYIYTYISIYLCTCLFVCVFIYYAKSGLRAVALARRGRRSGHSLEDSMASTEASSSSKEPTPAEANIETRYLGKG